MRTWPPKKFASGRVGSWDGTTHACRSVCTACMHKKEPQKLPVCKISWACPQTPLTLYGPHFLYLPLAPQFSRRPCLSTYHRLIGASLSEPHTSVTALQDAWTWMSGTYVRPYTENFNWTNGYDFAHVLKLFKIRSASAPKRSGLERRSEQTEVRQARLDRRRVRRAAVQPAARQTRLATDRQRTGHERRAAEQPEARQPRLERLARIERLRAQRKVEDARVCSMERTSFPSWASLACHAWFHHNASAAVCL